jgi:hypothetical protein
MPNIWVLCETQENLANIIYFRCDVSITQFYFLFSFFKYFSSQRQKQKMKVLHTMDQSYHGEI